MFAERRFQPVQIPRVKNRDLFVYSRLPYAFAVDDKVVRTRDNSLITSFEIKGLDGLTTGGADLEELAATFSKIIDGLDDRFTFYLHRMMRPADFGVTPLQGDTFEAAVEAKWQEHLNAQDLKEFSLVMTVLHRQVAPLRVPLLGSLAKKLLAQDTQARLADLNEMVSIIQNGLPITSQRLRLSDGSLLGLYSSLLDGVHRSISPRAGGLLSEDLANCALEFKTNHFEIHGGLDGTRYGAVLRVLNYPQATFCGILDALDASADTIISHSFTPIDKNVLRDRAVLKLGNQLAAEHANDIFIDQLKNMADMVEADQIGFGEHQLSITIFAATLAALEDRIGKISGACAQARVTMIREHSGATGLLEATFFASHPGNRQSQARDTVLSAQNFAHLAALHTTDVGAARSELPWKTPITVFQTASGAGHRFSFHEKGDPASEPTNGHTLVMGPSGSGKTLLVGFLVSQARRAGARVFMFDKDAGLKSTTDALGGQFAAIRAGQATGLNPLSTETDRRGQAWLLGWLVSLLESTGRPLTPQQSETLRNAIRQNATANPDLRNFENFQELIGDANDDRDLARRVGEWGPGGRYSWVFGQADQELVNYAESAVTTIDLTEILTAGTERTAVLAYLFRRIEVIIEDKAPTIIVIDEAWQVLNDDYFRKTLEMWLVAARKKNVVVIMMTQFPNQISSSKASSVIEGLPNQIIFPNRKAEAGDYEALGLNEAELEFILSGRGLDRFALLRGHVSSTILDVDLSPLGPLLGILGGNGVDEITAVTDQIGQDEFWRTKL